jgi:hypothetical protein
MLIYADVCWRMLTYADVYRWAPRKAASGAFGGPVSLYFCRQSSGNAPISWCVCGCGRGSVGWVGVRVFFIGGSLSIFGDNVVAMLHFDGLWGGGGGRGGAGGLSDRVFLWHCTLKDRFCSHTHFKFLFLVFSPRTLQFFFLDTCDSFFPLPPETCV